MFNTPEEKLFLLRVIRNVELASTDWTDLPSCPLDAETKAEFASYRQALRDLPHTLDLETMQIDESGNVINIHEILPVSSVVPHEAPPE